MRSDEELIEATIGGDFEAFDELMRRYERLVYRVVFGFVGCREAAMDVTQNVFLKAFRGLRGFRSQASFKTWLVRISYNESMNWSRSDRPHADGRESIEDFDDKIAVNATQEGELLANERLAGVKQAMGKLNDRYRLALVLRYFQGLGLGEIAEVLGCTEGVAKSILFRSVRSLRETLQGAV
ncbi:MAG: sigma-70 family RNA polymerase sigma factor [Acidobacteriota bacterium]